MFARREQFAGTNARAAIACMCVVLVFLVIDVARVVGQTGAEKGGGAAGAKDAAAVRAAANLQDFAWLAGAWKRSTPRGDVYEIWRHLGDRVLEGEVYRLPTGERLGSANARLTERILLAEFLGDVFYIAKPIENEMPTPFRLMSLDSTTAVFENPAHDFPKRILYARQGTAAVRVSIEGPADDGSTQRIDFDFKRAEP